MFSRELVGELVAEYLGTFILMMFGIGVVAMVVLFGEGVPGEVVKGGFTNITFAWGLGVMLGIYTAGKVTGAHINPAVTITLACLRGFPWKKVIPYCVAQTAGAFTAAALVYLNYYPAFDKTDPTRSTTAGIFTTFPAFPEQIWFGFIDQFVGTGLLLMMSFAVTEERNRAPGKLQPALIGLVVVAIGMSFGGMHGYAINPARDFGPRLFTVAAGFQNNGLTHGKLIFWVPIIAPILGGIAGGLLYDVGIRQFLPQSKGKPDVVAEIPDAED
jgi:glycerol uptake facilitator protein